MNQGQINAKCARLDENDKEALKEYGKTLTDDQKRQARCHLMTVRAIKKHAQRFDK
jgi:hypothetical protein